ncbi:MAG TPA: phosphopantothenoylcysteine decarboxylase [Verrucomicrobiae bacterium]|jgi:phosphopantothenoylcysteine decarboxylase/phosphopantothenate--cysteine ligase|nr:phosphopantothenoylcysteine decarboxylase [Verrucomicrobiae bacterium]
MNCVITAGPTYEPLDNVRRLTNFSTGRLGTELAGYLASRGHSVTLLLGEQATYRVTSNSYKTEAFTTTANLMSQLQSLSRGKVDAVFHAAAVSDYSFGKIWLRSQNGEMAEIKSGKIATRDGALLAELVPTPKIIASLREWYPLARLVGWKFEVEGNRASVIGLAERQMAECRTNASVANGRAYGEGFGLVTGAEKCEHLADKSALFMALEKFASR